jgi:hypothetical protein
MAGNTKKLAEAFAASEEVEGFLTNLEQLEAEGAITEEQYTVVRDDYYRRLGEATSEIARIKNQLKKKLQAVQHEIDARRKEMANLEVKYKVGELSLEQYQASEKKLGDRIRKLEQDGKELSMLIGATSTAAIGAPSTKSVSAAPRIPTLSRAAAQAKVAAPERRHRVPKGKLAAIIGCAVVLIGVVVAAVMLISGGKGGTALPFGDYATIEVPVNIEGAASVGSLHFELVYDVAVLRAIEVKNGKVLGDAMLEYSVATPGRVVVGIIDSEGFSGDGPLVLVSFQRKGDAEMTVPLELENVVAYDAVRITEITITDSAGSFTAGDGTFKAPTLRFTSAGG